jgi:hypothetical protein
MPNPSYVLYTGNQVNGSTTKFAMTGIDGWINNGFIEVYINDTKLTTGYQIIQESGVDKVQFDQAPASGTSVLIKRNTPNTISTFKSDIVDFDDGSVLTAAALDRAVEALVHISQENDDANATSLGLTNDQTAWDAESKRITNLAPGTGSGDAVTFGQYNTAAIFGGSVVTPQVWIINGNGGTTYALSNPTPLNTDSAMFIVENGGALVAPADYTVSTTQIVFTSGKSGTIHIRNFGVARNIAVGAGTIESNSLTTAMLQDGAVTTPKIANLAVTNDKIANATITVGKIVGPGKNKLLATGNAVTFPQTVTTIDYTDYAKTLLEAANATAAGETLGLEDLAYVKIVGPDNIASGAVTEPKIASGAVTPAKLSANGPVWDANSTTVGTSSGSFNSPGTTKVQIERAGRIGAKTVGGGDLWTGYNDSGTVSTTIPGSGNPTVATDLTTKAYVDLSNVPYNIPVSPLGAFIQYEASITSALRVGRLAVINYEDVNRFLTGNPPNGLTFTRITNNTGGQIKIWIEQSRCIWEGNGPPILSTTIPSPTNIDRNAVVNIAPAAGSGINFPDWFPLGEITINAGQSYYLRNWDSNATGWENWTGSPLRPPETVTGITGRGCRWFAHLYRTA